MHTEFPPHETLADAIRCFWYDRRDFGVQSSYEIMPDGYAEIVFHFGNPCTISYNSITQALPSPCIMGLLNQPVVLETKGILLIIGIRCYPWTVFDLLGLPPGKESIHTIEHPIAKLQSTLQKLVDHNKIEEAIDHVKQYFLDAQSQISVDSMLYKAGVAMRKASGKMSVSDVAAAAHATVRTLERNFKQSSGHTVKDVTSLIRFEKARNQLWIDPNTNLAGLAHELGYTDQSHLSREFKRYSGITPAAFARKSKTQRNDFVAFVLA